MTLDPLPAGKLPARSLQALLAGLPRTDPRVLVGPRLGEDAAVIDMGDRCLVVTTDPITFATDRIGWYAVHVNANDVAVMGARPRWFFIVLLLPEHGTTAAAVEAIMDDVASSCAALGVDVCGGHTEITTDLSRPIAIGQMIGEAPRPQIVLKGGLAPGDHVLLTHGAAIEGTALLAREKADVLGTLVPPDLLERASGLLFTPGISVVRAALAAVEAGGVGAMHDPTEGGILTGLYELAAASGQGLIASADHVPILPETQCICEALAIDPLRLIASGALLIGAAPEAAAAIAAALGRLGIPVAQVAEVRPAAEGLVVEREGRRLPLVPAERDEIARVFERSDQGAMP